MRGELFHHLQRPVVVAMSVVRMMQFAINQIIHVVAVRNARVAAVGTVNVLPVMAFRSQRAFVRVDVADGNGVFIHVVAVRMMQMPVVEIIHVPFVHDGEMPAIFAVDMGMVRVSFAGLGFVHRFCSLVWFFTFVPSLSARLNYGGGGLARNISANNLHDL